MVTPKGTSYLTTDGGYTSEITKLSSRVQSSQSLLGLAGLEGHEESEGQAHEAGKGAEGHEDRTREEGPSCEGQEASKTTGS